MHRLWLLFAQTVTVLVAGFFVISTLRPEWLGKSAETRPAASESGASKKEPSSSTSTPTANQSIVSYRLAAEQAMPS
ncbi:MAG: 2-alkenal reductase, partial [Betaproteobacteria bacterium]|nr:2-alkenal reductase [Betaproteobacteria bacterium]